uniref:Uncharacterized protein n=1 Tax=Ditylenchus dipsaci TaxID=166011 RepID=A0A915EV80_9BILA
MWKKLALVYFIVFKDVCMTAKTKKESSKDDEVESNNSSSLFQYDCKLPDGRPYKSTIPCPAYTPDGRVVLRAPAGNPNVCANAGRFLNTYCIADYNCNANNPQSGNNNNQAGQQGNNPQSNSNTSGGQVECIRGYCCTRTSTQKDKVNVRNQQDTNLCTNGGYSMANTCSQDVDCNPNDGMVGPPGDILYWSKCINGNCCSRPYKKPTQNQFCLNGGKSIGQDCVLSNDCRAANTAFNNNNNNNNNNNQRTGNNRNNNNNLGGGRLECVEHTCCTQPSFNQPFNDDGGGDAEDNSDDDSEDSEENNVCRNGGQVLRDNNGQIIYCGKHNDCGANVTNGRRHAICSNGRCCSNSRNSNGVQPRGSDFRRGTSVCSSLVPAPAIYTGKHCQRPSDCGYSTYNTYSCAGGYCCEEDDELVNPGPAGTVSQRDRVCNHQGYYLGINCLDDTDCDHLRQSPARANVCINRSCCSIPIRLDPDIDGADGQFCRGGEYGHYLEETCASTADCPVYAGANGIRIPVRCRGLSDVGNNPPGLGQQGVAVIPRRPAGSIAICYDGTLSAAECPQGHECQTGHSCVNHLCCPKREDERQYVCGGLAANGDCFANGQCRSNLFCTPAKLCCECRYGQPQIGVGLGVNLDCRQNAALCKPGYICNSGGFCCPKCPNNEVPFGSCSSGKCGNGYACQPGNICCAAALSYAPGLVPARDRLAYDPYYNQRERRNGLK